jgi:DNA helicase HerA-like ATPase
MQPEHLDDKNQRTTPSVEEVAASTDLDENQQEATTDSATQASRKYIVLGKVLFNIKDQFNLRADQNKDEIKGFLFEEHAPNVKPLDILVLESQDCQKKIYASVIRIDMNPMSGAGYVGRFYEIATHVVFQPLVEVTNDYKGRARPTNLSGFIIRRPKSSELLEVLNVPQNGLPLGWLEYSDSIEIFRFPMQPEDTLYQSIILAGVQGKGKTNTLHMLIRSLASNSNIGLQNRPAIVILDGEGQYKKFTKKSQMNNDSRYFLDKYGIGDVEPKVYVLNDDSNKSNSTLSLRGIDRHDLIYLMPELESKTENILQILINHVSRALDYERTAQDIDTLRNRLISETNSSGLVHFQQRPAIARAILSPSLNLLDQKDKILLTPGVLFTPGSVSVIDYQGLDQNKKRVVVVYLLQLLSRFKMDAPNYEPGVLLVIDEAELLFPANPSKGDKDYVLRIASRMEDITNRGRKRKYGVVLVTHLPSEVSQKVGELANTKIAFGCSGANKWIRDHFGKEYVSEINSLPTGICRIKVKVDNDKQGPINAKVRIPFVGRNESRSTSEKLR